MKVKVNGVNKCPAQVETFAPQETPGNKPRGIIQESKK